MCGCFIAAADPRIRRQGTSAARRYGNYPPPSSDGLCDSVQTPKEEGCFATAFLTSFHDQPGIAALPAVHHTFLACEPLRSLFPSRSRLLCVRPHIRAHFPAVFLPASRLLKFPRSTST